MHRKFKARGKPTDYSTAKIAFIRKSNGNEPTTVANVLKSSESEILTQFNCRF